MELTILMPCLNEEETLEVCIKKAKTFLKENNVDGEVLIADNGSTDKSVEIAESNGARIVRVKDKGYGSALRGGSEAALGKYVIMGDADDSYDFLNLMPFLEKLREGYDLVMGNRFKGGIEKGAMPFLHRYLGNPVLSTIGRILYKSKIKDFHCGLRGYNRDSIHNLQLITTGMEYASEMVVQAELNNLKIIEIPTTLKKDGRSGKPHLQSFRDGWRHLTFLLMYSPNSLFFYPGLFFMIVGLICSIIILMGDFYIGKVSFGIHTLLYTCAAIVIGINIIFLDVYTKVYAYKTRFIPRNKTIERIAKYNMNKGIAIGFILFLLGIMISILGIVVWKKESFGQLDPTFVMRLLIPAVTVIIIGIQILFASFFIGILNIEHRKE